MSKGKFVVVDGPDGIGKGVIESALVGKVGGRVFDSVAWCKENPGKRPSVDLLEGYKGVLTAEPSYSGVGLDIRNFLISKNRAVDYSAEELIQAYSLDRHMQMAEFVVPALERGYDVIQSRSFASTLCYQILGAENEGRDASEVRKIILSHPGNAYELEHRPDVLIIPQIGNVEELVDRLNNRKKMDNAIFENPEFLRRLNDFYGQGWVREIFEKAGAKVVYLDAGISVESSREQAEKIWDDFFAS